MSDDRCLTVRQPWAWAIALGEKSVENRTLRTAWRGTLWIHAGAGWSQRGAEDVRVLSLAGGLLRGEGEGLVRAVRGGVVAVCELVDCHPAAGCCKPWGEDEYLEAGGRRRTDVWHWKLEGIRRLRTPVAAVGRLGLWRPGPDLLEELRRAA